MKLLYYPGCTIKRNALEYERTSLAVLNKLGIDVIELDKWYCCGALYSLAIDDLMKHLGAVRTLVKAQVQSRNTGTNDLLTLCPMCFNVLKRVNKLLIENPDNLETIAKFMDEEEPYNVGVNVYHIVEILSNNIEKLKENIVKDLNGVNIAVYYGCTLLRPKEIAIDDPEHPWIIEKLIEDLGGKIVDYPFKSECCGSYQVLINRDIVYDKSGTIINEASTRGADLIVTVCPLCYYNLKITLKNMKRPPKAKIVYISELLAYLLGLDKVLSTETKALLENVFSQAGKNV
ncbi:MAG: heterodisulfide reductase, subunit B [Thermoprotei archaeon]|nr:MAG: heterodisulfide reductase, subunit B [Thermoprotei archaeon]